MCGIHVSLSPSTSLSPSLTTTHDPSTTTNNTSSPSSPSSPWSPTSSSIPESLALALRARGPDHFGQVQRSVVTPTAGGWSVSLLSLCFTSTVLALRGDHVARQPLVGDSHGGEGSVLCWNGEAWRVGAGANGVGEGGGRVIGLGENDGEVVLGLLMAASSSVGAGAGGGCGTGSSVQAVIEVLRGIEGPFAFVYYDAAAQVLFFGRDCLGRRSLMIKHDAGSGEMVLCSVAGEGESWKEVEADGIYTVKLRAGTGMLPERHEWLVDDGGPDLVSGIGRFNKALPCGDHPALTAASSSVAELKEQLVESLRLRLLNVPQPPCASGNTRVAVLFSGGLDCTVLARLAHEVLEPDQRIDLLNVAFENPRVVAQLRKESNGNPPDLYEACPDRITGRRSFSELQKACPGRAFRFVAVNVPYTETQAHRHQVISLMRPHNTEMDLSIAYALYFAARGQGWCTESSSPNSHPSPYTSPARVLLSGLGADELFGGYSRHSSAFQQGGYAGLIDELLLDVGRLGKRNLGRDDRVMAHWGKEVRFPYLDERLVRWAIQTPAWEKCDFEHGEDVSGVEAGKRILRLVALGLGLPNVAKEKKRAIQFGSRTAKMESGRIKGTTPIS